MKFLALFTFCILSFPASSQEKISETLSDEEWECESEIVGKSEVLDNGFTYCSSSGDWACYFEIEEVCKDQISGSTRTSRFDQFRFCTRTLSDCF